MLLPGRQVVLVSGAPGAGKTSLAVPLAAELGFMLLAKDRIKESLHEGLGAQAVSLEWSRQLGAASMELLWALAADAPAVVLEANFRPRSEYQRGRVRALGGRVVEVNCDCPAEIAARRFAERAVRSRHRVHVITSLTTDEMAEYDRPVGIGELITVDTSVPVDVRALGRQVRALLAAPA
jgi:predicted kinase